MAASQRREMTVFCFSSRLFFLILALSGPVILGCNRAGSPGESASSDTVVVYTSADQPFAEPVLKAYREKTGVDVRMVFDTEETKTTGLVNRLQAEKNNPQADIFWSSDPGRGIAITRMGLTQSYVSPNAAAIPATFKDPQGLWSGFAARARVLIVNTELVPERETPQSLSALTDPKWRGKACIANPLFGTTSFHATALFAKWGDGRAERFFRDLKANGVQILDSNGAVKDQVSAGLIPWGVTDTDDANVAIQDGKPVRMVYPDQEEGGMGTPLMPNTVSLIKGAPHPEAGKQLADYLLSPEVEAMLAKSASMNLPLHPGVETPPHVKAIDKLRFFEVDYGQVAAQVQEVDRRLQSLLGL
jgi:iron(III) transport system substrate-binding protein